MATFKPLHLLIPIAFAASACTANPGPGVPGTQETTEGGQALAQHYPNLHALLDRVEIAHRVLYERMTTEMPEIEVPDMSDPDAGHGAHGGHDEHAGHQMDPGDVEANPWDDATYEELAGLIRMGGQEAHDHPPVTEGALSTRLTEIVRRTHVLHRRILDAYADPDVSDPQAAAEAAIDEYLSEPELALPPRPKAMDLMHSHSQATAFRRTHAKLSGLIWASHWLQLAAFDPFFQRTDPEARAEGISLVITRLGNKLANPPEGFPTQMPMAPTIAPSLLHFHPRAAAIFDNLHMLHEVVADLLVHPNIQDKRVAIDAALAGFTAPDSDVADRGEWLRMALRHGIFNQGGPALGTLTRSERNVEIGDHDHGTHIILQGMPQ